MSFFESILNNINDAIVVFDTKGRLVYINKAGEESLGRSYRELRDRKFNSIFYNIPDIVEIIQKTLSEQRSFRKSATHLNNTDDAEIDIRTSLIFDESTKENDVDKIREIKGVILSMRENTSFATPEDYHFDSLLYLLSSIAHEIKNPLSGIKGACQLLLKDEMFKNNECLSMILKETDRLNKVLQNYLTITKRPIMNEINIHEVLEHSTKVLHSDFVSNKIRLVKSYDPSLPDILGDESKLLQVFINVLKNAIEAVSERTKGREIVITTRVSNDYVMVYDVENTCNTKEAKRQRWLIVTIRDNGKGIDQEQIKKIFLPFYTSKKEGSGLGLALSKKIVKDHGGIIKVKSKKLEWTQFNIYLPLRMVKRDE
ncbi:MAG: ATP-binding protein [Thermodesulfovibrionales bacterium]|nr:ATP-binding protein [Thermodesulfovibrionales bacterium]